MDIIKFPNEDERPIPVNMPDGSTISLVPVAVGTSKKKEQPKRDQGLVPIRDSSDDYDWYQEQTANLLKLSRFVRIGGNLWQFRDGRWQYRSQTDFAAWAIKMLEGRGFIKASQAKRLYEEVLLRATPVDREGWRRRYEIDGDRAIITDRADYAIRFPNGVYFGHRLLAGKQPFTSLSAPGLFAQDVVDFEYNAAATCPLWERLLAEWLPHEADRLRLQEWAGLCTVYETRWHHFLCLFGATRAGKSVVKTIIERLLPAGLRSAIQLDRFGTQFNGELLGKLLNVSPDVPAVQLTRSQEGFLKALTGGDAVSIERKHHESVRADPTARLMLVANEWFEISDVSRAIPERMLVIQFQKSVAADQRDKKLLDKLTAELPGIFNWSTYGLKRLHDQGDFTLGGTHESGLADFQHFSFHVQEFIAEYLAADPDGFTPTDWIMSLYSRWADANNIERSARLKTRRMIGAVRSAFGLGDCGNERHTVQPTIHLQQLGLVGGQFRGLRGVTIREIYDEEEECENQIGELRRTIHQLESEIEAKQRELRHLDAQITAKTPVPIEDIRGLLDELEGTPNAHDARNTQGPVPPATEHPIAAPTD